MEDSGKEGSGLSHPMDQTGKNITSRNAGMFIQQAGWAGRRRG